MKNCILTISQYLESKKTTLERIMAYNAIIESMELKLLDAVGNSDLEEYQMEDGQIKIRTRFRTVKEVNEGIKALEQSKERLINNYNGRGTVLRGGNFY